jgi:hypothetical protein
MFRKRLLPQGTGKTKAAILLDLPDVLAPRCSRTYLKTPGGRGGVAGDAARGAARGPLARAKDPSRNDALRPK